MENMERSFTFQTKPTVKELWKFSMHYANKGLRGGVNMILVGGSLFLLLTRWGQLELFQRLMLFFIMFLFLIWQPAMLYPKCLRQAKELEKQPPLVLTFAEDGVEVSQGKEKGHIEWEDIGKIEAVGDMIIVYGDRVHASLIPRASMGEDEEGFRKLVREKLPKARCRRI